MELEELEALDQLVGLVAMVERHLGDLELLVLDDQLLEVVVDLGRHPFHHPYYPMNPRKQNEKQTLRYKTRVFKPESPTCWIGAGFLGPPGLGGDNLGLSKPLDNQSFLTGGGTGVDTVAIDTSPERKNYVS